MNKVLINFVKNNRVLLVSWVFAVVSMVFNMPSCEYLSYINFDVLILLFCMMIVVEGLSEIGLFKSIAYFMLKKTNNTRKLTFYFVFLCFFFSMLITNDVALITFVPFTIMVLTIADLEKNILFTVILETAAANLGSMMTPIGNPQNLYLYSVSNIDILDFFYVVAPYTVISLLILIILCFSIKKENLIGIQESDNYYVNKSFRLYIYIVLFILCILSVLKVFNYYVLFIILCGIIFFVQKKLFFKVDYNLLFTFVGFFIFIGNIGKITEVTDIFKEIFIGNEVIVSIVLSQFISNVPAALLLSEFTDNYKNIIIGVNIGGIGTLIASMASLISYKYYMKTKYADGKKYIVIFSLTNIIILSILYLFYYIFK